MSGKRYYRQQDSGRDIYSGASKTNHKRLWIIGGCVLAAVVVVCAVGAGIKMLGDPQVSSEEPGVEQTAERTTFPKGIVVEGIDLEGMTLEEATAAVKAVEPSLSTCNITLTSGDKSWTLTNSNFTYTYNTDEVLQEAFEYGKQADEDLLSSLETQPKTYEITATPDTTNLKETLTTLTQEVNQAAKDATVKSFDAASETFTFEEGQNGVTVNIDELTQQVEALLQEGGTGTVEVPVTETAYQVSAADLKANMKKLGTYSTVSTNTSNGNTNMRLALEAVNGTCIPAGGTFDYWQVVGNTTPEKGYKQANAIINGKFVPSYGGGVCQTSTTIYGAALRSAMEIVQRSSHSIKATYCPIGQDAAVSYPDLNFSFKNPTNYPVYISAGMSGKTLTVTMYGYQSPDYDTIEITSQLTETIQPDSTPKYTVDNSMAKGTMHYDAAPREGYRASAQRIYYKNGQVVKTEKLPNSYYRPAPAYYSIGPDTDPATAVLVDYTGKPVNGTASNSVTPSSSTPETTTPPASSTPETTTPPATNSEPETTTPPTTEQPADSSSEQPPATTDGTVVPTVPDSGAETSADVQPDPEAPITPVG